jgi:lambda family phage portal protein
MPRRTSSYRSSLAALKDEMRREYRADYAAATPSTFRRRREGQGGLADAHYYSESRFLQMMEGVRDMERNDWLVGAILDRLTDNLVRNGFSLEPQTGGKVANRAVWEKHQAWATDKTQCDVAREHDWTAQQRMALRQRYMDGGIFAIPITDPGDDDYGRIQMLEADRCRTPTRSARNIVHGVELSPRGRRLRYYFVRQEIDRFSRTLRVKDTTPIDAFDADGLPQVLHVYKPSRVSQTRGVTALHGCFDLSGIMEDIHFAEVIRRQIASSIGLAIETDVHAPDPTPDLPLGDRQTFTQANGFDDILEKIAPGMILRLRKGQTAKNIGTSIPGEGFLSHFKLVLQSIGACVGLPLIMLLLDGSETNFSGWRGAVDQAKIGFVCEQHIQKVQFCRPVHRLNVRRWMQEDPAFAKLHGSAGDDGTPINLFAHDWKAPKWPYIQPLQDAQAAMIRVNTGQSSPRRIAAENGEDFEEIAEESVRDTEYWIDLAMAGTERLKTKYPDIAKDLHWSHLYHRDFPRGVQILDTIDEEQSAAAKKTK